VQTVPKLGNLFGYRRLFKSGAVSFAAAWLPCVHAQRSGELVAARPFQGLTGAAVVPQVLALITATFAGAGRSRARHPLAASPPGGYR
jgi:MFS family permease